jgi:phospho-N-acetylmuramoyl-pentapeptide-transferase
VEIVAVVNAVKQTDGLVGWRRVLRLLDAFFSDVRAQERVTGDGTLSCIVNGLVGILMLQFQIRKSLYGDSVSMALADQSVVSVLTRTELYLMIAGAVFVIEMLSVALQIGYFKLSHGKRLFKMAPIHPHFEFTGWSETLIVIVFWAVSAFCVLFSMLSLNLHF